jgi:hypothetical protein
MGIQGKSGEILVKISESNWNLALHILKTK